MQIYINRADAYFSFLYTFNFESAYKKPCNDLIDVILVSNYKICKAKEIIILLTYYL